MDYCEKVQVHPEEEIKMPTIKMNIQEALKILGDMSTQLSDLKNFLCGPGGEEDRPRNACCLSEESGFLTELAYECLKKVQAIKNVIY